MEKTIVLSSTPNIDATANLVHTLEAAGYDVNTVLSELLDEHFKACNDAALKSGDRILSKYNLETEIQVYVITDQADENGMRETTTVMSIQDY